MEPSVNFALNGPNSVTLGLSLPYTFDWPALFTPTPEVPLPARESSPAPS